MKKNKTLAIFLIDHSGSMNSIKDSTEKGFSSFIEKQKDEPGECEISLYEFDNIFDVVYENKNINDVGEYTLKPRAWTSLRDAIGTAINRAGKHLLNLSENERPETVIFTVLTDGLENTSKEFSQENIKEMIELQTSKYNWKFVFLGANQDAVITGKKYGFSPETSMSYFGSDAGVRNAFSSLNSGISCMRVNSSNYSFSDEQRKMSMKH